MSGGDTEGGEEPARATVADSKESQARLPAETESEAETGLWKEEFSQIAISKHPSKGSDTGTFTAVSVLVRPVSENFPSYTVQDSTANSARKLSGDENWGPGFYQIPQSKPKGNFTPLTSPKVSKNSSSNAPALAEKPTPTEQFDEEDNDFGFSFPANCGAKSSSPSLRSDKAESNFKAGTSAGSTVTVNGKFTSFIQSVLATHTQDSEVYAEDPFVNQWFEHNFHKAEP